MNALVACEESQRVTMALRALGVNAFSCDIDVPSGGHPEWHIQQDVIPLINGDCSFTTNGGGHHEIVGPWDLLIAHPPCTYLTSSGAVRLRVKGEIQQERYQKGLEAKEFFMEFYNARCSHICVENPTPIKLYQLPPYSQIIQPWQYGHAYTKRTCLWLKGLPILEPTKIITEGIQPWVNGGNKDVHGNYRQFKGRNERDPKNRSKTFPGIAQAMAEQWVSFIRREQTEWLNQLLKEGDRKT